MSKTSKSKKIKLPKMDDIMAQIKADQLKKADRVKYHSNLLFDTLAQTKVSSIEVSFEGCGDSGQIESVDYTDANGKGIDEAYLDKVIVKGSERTSYHEWDEKKKQMVLTEAREGNVRGIIEEICYDKLGASHGGWELNEGSYGTFYFDVSTRKVRLEYNERIEEVRTSEESF
ncbi:MAG: hypothetical protein EBY20_04815 [Alphaproteobacteria bacterium]|nr:hypothetical protein [Alphaproteobacteria bacterium]